MTEPAEPDDEQLLGGALIRTAFDSGRRHDLDDVLAEANIDPDDLDQNPE